MTSSWQWSPPLNNGSTDVQDHDRRHRRRAAMESPPPREREQDGDAYAVWRAIMPHSPSRSGRSPGSRRRDGVEPAAKRREHLKVKLDEAYVPKPQWSLPWNGGSAGKAVPPAHLALLAANGARR